MIYCNFEDDFVIGNLFSTVSRAENLLMVLEEKYHKPVDENTLLILDEIPLCPRGFARTKVLCEKISSVRIACAGSLMGVALRPGTSYPGNARTERMFPMTFDEFFNAKKEALKIEENEENLLLAYREYSLVGGLPECVQLFLETKDFDAVRILQKRIIDIYEGDFAKHIDSSVHAKLIHILWKSIPKQLMRHTGEKHFSFQQIKIHGKRKDYDVPLSWLEDCGLIHLARRIDNAQRVPFSLYESMTFFRIHLLDIGILSALLDVSPKLLSVYDFKSSDIRGILAEQFVAQHLVMINNWNKLWFSNENGYEIDFLFYSEKLDIIPIEVKSGKTRISESIKRYKEKYHPHCIIVASARVSQQDDAMYKEIPIYKIESFLTNNQQLETEKRT